MLGTNAELPSVVRILRALNSQFLLLPVPGARLPRGLPRCWAIQEPPARRAEATAHPSLESDHFSIPWALTLTLTMQAWGAGPPRRNWPWRLLWDPSMTAQLRALEGEWRDLGLNIDVVIRIAMPVGFLTSLGFPPSLGFPSPKQGSWNMVSLRPPLQF